ncbi:cytochrome b562 [Thalassotalea euphylliae]|uniref:cytochrome b562 n=1 Tax=Thalassotalea euphylliae TaxID=1655234 RepID=UPI003643BE90
MKKTTISVALASFLFAMPAMAAHPMCGKTDLADIMGNMKDQMKVIKKAAKTGDMATLNETAQKLLAQVEKADSYVPLAISDKKELDATQQADYEKYQKGMGFLKQSVEELIAAKDPAAIKAALGKIGKSAKKGHKAFKMDCDD